MSEKITEYRANPAHWDSLAKDLKTYNNAVFIYCIEKSGTLLISITKKYAVLGAVPFNMGTHTIISIANRGCEVFENNLHNDSSAPALIRRLGLNIAEAKSISQLLRALGERLE